MEIQALLEEKREEILQQCTRETLENHSLEFSRFFQKKNDQFMNPIGFNVASSLAAIFDHLTGKDTRVSLDRTLDDIVRVRAVQDMAPSMAVSFPFSMKRAIQDTFQAAGIVPDAQEYQALNEQIDEITRKSFDIYMKCREQVFQIKLDEIKSGIFMDVPQGASCPSSLLDSWSDENK